ncbi:MAG: hypothetical protein HeimC3_40010 [Candidatus Heimdallarchaeota archaeon LC_3]|nr:MAG: hypothetical protein HeimC3_40010 [Candidatus Heimdallarchaeota archaeon LC_3]
MDDTKIFFESIPDMKAFICLGIANEFCSDSHRSMVLNFITSLKTEIIEFLINQLTEIDLFNENSENKYLTCTIIDKVYHRHFPSLGCLLDPKE